MLSKSNASGSGDRADSHLNEILGDDDNASVVGEVGDVDLPDPGSPYKAHAGPANHAVYTLHCLLGNEGCRSFEYVVEENAEYEMTIISRPEGKKGWVKLPIRWTVERTLAWLGRCRRLSKDREKTVGSSESFVKLAMIQLMLPRLRPDGIDPEFRYRQVA